MATTATTGTAIDTGAAAVVVVMIRSPFVSAPLRSVAPQSPAARKAPEGRILGVPNRLGGFPDRVGLSPHAGLSRRSIIAS